MEALMIRTLAAAVLTLAMGSSPAAADSATAFGDSFTAGRSWYGQLHLGDDNFAKGGAAANPDFANVPTNTLARQLQRWRAAGKPTNDWVIVFIGINDIEEADETFSASRSAYVQALKELRAAGAKLILVKAPDLGRTPKYAGTSRADDLTDKTVIWNKFVAKQAKAFNAGLVDLFSKLSSRNLYGSDGFHPSDAGQKIIANAIGAKL
jgi:lysophospholipase L1-like esterase